MQEMSAAEICQLADFYENEVVLVECKMSKKNRYRRFERSGLSTGASAPGKNIVTQFSKREDLQSVHCRMTCVSHGTVVRIIQGLEFYTAYGLYVPQVVSEHQKA